MNLITIHLIDRDSSDTYSRTFHTDSVLHFKKNVKAFEEEIVERSKLRKYELMTDEVMEITDYSGEIIDALEELEVEF